jgi:flagellar assembly protein FliH
LSKFVREDTTLQRVLEYTPRKFELGVSAPAKEFQETQSKRGSDFRMADALRIQTGLSKVEAQQSAEVVEKRALEKLKEIQESAYQEAYSIGLEDGKKEAFTKASTQIDESLKQMAHFITGIEKLKHELLKQNEAHIMKLVLHIAGRLAMHEVQVNQETLVEVLRAAIETAQAEEEVSVQVSSQQFEFMEKLRAETGREYEFLKKVKLSPNDTIQPGGCVIETNYGVIDARFEERVSKLWETVADNLYKSKDKVGAA